MKWLFVEEQGNSVIYRCSVCNSEISVKHGEELPYCKHCESEPDGEQIANKMSDNEIIKAWECCTDEMGCTKGCPCFNPKAKGSHCTVAKKFELENLTLDLIKRQKEQIESLIAGQETLQKALNEKISEVKMLQTYITNHPYRVGIENADIYTKNHEEYEKLLAKISAEAVKEVFEKLRTECTERFLVSGDTVIEILNEVEKEMVGEG